MSFFECYVFHISVGRFLFGSFQFFSCPPTPTPSALPTLIFACAVVSVWVAVVVFYTDRIMFIALAFCFLLHSYSVILFRAFYLSLPNRTCPLSIDRVLQASHRPSTNSAVPERIFLLCVWHISYGTLL